NQTSAYGPIKAAANIKASGGDQKVSFTWNPNIRDYENGRGLTMTVTVDGQRVDAARGSFTKAVGHSTKSTIVVRVDTTLSTSAQLTEQWSESATSNEAPPPPDPSLSLSRGSSAYYAGNCTISCYHMGLN